MARSKAESALTLPGHVSATFKLTSKQSLHFEQLHPMRLLRYARNDCIGDFLRNHQYCPCDI